MDILKYPHNTLRKKTDAILDFNDELSNIAEEMFKVMIESNGIGLAAPQVGISKKIIVLHTKGIDPENGFSGVLINPEILYLSDTQSEMEEGCLSFPGKAVSVSRHKIAVVKYQELDGSKKAMTCIGITAICIQHEIDHLNGKLFIDYQKEQ